MILQKTFDRFRLCICYTKLLLDFGRSFAHTNLYFSIWDVQYIYLYLTAIIILLLDRQSFVMLSPAEPKTYGSVWPLLTRYLNNSRDHRVLSDQSK